MISIRNRNIVVSALKHAAPYIRLYKRQVFVIKAGGDMFAEPASARAFVEQVGVLHQLGIRIILVHGGGPQSTRLASELGLETRFIDGRRVTDGPSLHVATMVLNGEINTRILADCRDLGVPAVGISGVDAGLIEARRRPPVATADGSDIDYGHVGDVVAVHADLLRTQLDNGYVPVVSPLSCDDDGNLLNINADTIAAALAGELKAEKLVLATAAPGILRDREDPHSLVSYVDLAGLNGLRNSGALDAGMLPKAAAIEAAIQSGVARVHVISYRQSDSLLLEVFTNEGTGTLIVEDIAALSPAEQAAED